MKRYELRNAERTLCWGEDGSWIYLRSEMRRILKNGYEAYIVDHVTKLRWGMDGLVAERRQLEMVLELSS